jgi:rod shape-determining protein MreC
MESFLNRYRNITVLLLAICGQLVLLGLQKNDQDVQFIRTWTVTAVTPAAGVVEWLRGGSIGIFRNYFVLRNAAEDNRRLREENGRLRIENTFLKNDLATAERAQALKIFQERTPSSLLAANVIGIGAGSNSKMVYVNRGSTAGIMRGMAVITPEGIVGKVIAAYPTASEVLLVTDSDFAAGVISQKGQTRGTLKGQGTPLCKVDYIPTDDKVEVGDWFYTSGDDRIFVRGFAVGVVKSVSTKAGSSYKEILLDPSGLQRGLEDVLIIKSGVHQEIPDAPATNQPVFISPPPPDAIPGGAPAQTNGTEADRLRSIYKAAGEEQNHFFGEGPPGSKPPDFSKIPTNPGSLPSKPGSGSGRAASGQPPPAAGRAGSGAGTVAAPPAAAPVRNPAAGRGPTSISPNSALPKSPPPKSLPANEPVRRSNQNAGAPGGPPRE